MTEPASPRVELPDPVWRALRASLGGSPCVGAPPDEVAEAARRGGVAPLLATSGDPVFVGRLADDLSAAVARDALLEQTERRIAAALGELRACLLKGGATGRLIYDSPFQRPRRDVDVLLPDGDLDEAARRLEEAGWVRRPVSTWWARDEAPYEVTLAWELPGGGAVECDLHRRLAAWKHLDVDTSAILGRAVDVGAPLPACEPTDALLHTSLHAVTSGFCVPLRSWVDVARLVNHPDVDLSVAAGRARRWGVARALWLALRIVRRWRRAESATLSPDAPSLRPRARAALATLLSGDGEHPIRRLGAATRPAVTAAKAIALGDGVACLRMLTQLLSRPSRVAL